MDNRRSDQKLVALCVLGLALTLAEGVVVRQMSGAGACGVNSAELNHEVEPEMYHVSLELTDLQAPKFAGQVEIEVNVKGNKEDNLRANQIYLNADESIEIEDAWYEKTGAFDRLRLKRPKVLEVCLNVDRQVLVVTLNEDLQPGSKGKLGFRYKAAYGKNVGLTKKSARFGGEQLLKLAFSGNNFARYVFPSFDDTSFLAKIELEVTCAQTLKPLSNKASNVDSETTRGGHSVNKFKPTKKIATKDLVLTLFA